MENGKFLFVEDHDDSVFYLELPDGAQSEWAGNDEVAILDDGSRTYIATNCDDFPGMQAGKIYAVGGTPVLAEIVDYADLDEDETEEGAAPTEEEEDEEEEAEVDEDEGAAG